MIVLNSINSYKTVLKKTFYILIFFAIINLFDNSLIVDHIMQIYHPFFPNYPPPPIPTRESIVTDGLKILEQSKLDHQWLNNWIERKKQSSSNPITLSDYRQQLIHHTHLLQQYEHALKHSNHEILLQLKPKIEQSSILVYDHNIIKKIHRRKSKRARLRRQKEKKLTDTINEQPTNEKSFDEKIQDINSLLQIIEKLKQLKTTRQQQQMDSNTIDELIEIHSICTAKLLEYQNEMETKSHSPLYNYLFNNHDRSFYESINFDAQYFLRAHQNINDLVQIRQAWDQYSTTHISSLDNIISMKWHEPQVPCDSNWARYIFDKKE